MMFLDGYTIQNCLSFILSSPLKQWNQLLPVWTENAGSEKIMKPNQICHPPQGSIQENKNEGSHPGGVFSL